MPHIMVFILSMYKGLQFFDLLKLFDAVFCISVISTEGVESILTASPTYLFLLAKERIIFIIDVGDTSYAFENISRNLAMRREV